MTFHLKEIALTQLSVGLHMQRGLSICLTTEIASTQVCLINVCVMQVATSVYIDESGFNIFIRRIVGRAPRGESVRRKVCPRGRNVNITLPGHGLTQ